MNKLDAILCFFSRFEVHLLTQTDTENNRQKMHVPSFVGSLASGWYEWARERDADNNDHHL